MANDSVDSISAASLDRICVRPTFKCCLGCRQVHMTKFHLIDSASESVS